MLTTPRDADEAAASDGDKRFSPTPVKPSPKRSGLRGGVANRLLTESARKAAIGGASGAKDKLSHKYAAEMLNTIDRSEELIALVRSNSDVEKENAKESEKLESGISEVQGGDVLGELVAVPKREPSYHANVGLLNGGV